MAEDITNLLQEVDDSLRVENMEKLMRRYGKLVLAACVAIVIGTAVSVFWKNHMHELNARQTDTLLDASDLVDSGKYADAQKMLENSDQTNGATISRLMLAETLIEQGQADKAVKVLDEAGSGNTPNLALRDLSALDAQIISDNHNLPAQKDNVETLKRLYDSNSPFSSTAGLLYALQLHKAGKSKEAQDILASISNNPTLSIPQRAQAKNLLEMIKEGKP